MKTSSEFELPLSLLREEVARSALLPGVYRRYRPLLADGLRFFLERLSPARLRGLFEEQANLPLSTSTAQRVVALLHHVPALHKLGQVVARDRRLNADFRKRLQQLESLEPRTPMEEVVGLLNKEFRHWQKAGIQLEPEPLAEGSVAVVIPFVWQKARGRLREGVFKLLKPGIQRLLEEDLEILGCLGDFLDEDCARYHLPELDYGETFETIRELLLHEIRFEHEQKHLAEAAQIYAAMPSVAIPGLFPFCSPHLTAMERLYGGKITTEIRALSPAARRALGRTAAEALVAMPLFSARPAALFHADPHAGNLLLTPQGRVGILDWSLVGRLGKTERIGLVQLLLGALALDVEQMAWAIQVLARKEPAPGALREVLHESLREVRWGVLPGLTWLIQLLDQVAVRAGGRFGGQLLLFRKTLLTLEGVLADLAEGPGREHREVLDEAVLASFAQRWLAEWPERFKVPPAERSFATHVSTADLWSLLWSSPATLTRWWSGTMLDLLQAASSVMISTTRFSLGAGAEEKAR